MLAVDATDSTLQQSSKDAGDARQREADVISAHVCQRYWGSGADEFEAPHVDGVSRSSMGEAPIWVVQHPTADTILCCLRLLCSAFASNQRARGLFVDTTGVTPLLRVLVHYGKMLTSDTPAGDANVQCFVGSLMCYAWLTARPHSFEVAVDPFHAACAESGVTTVSSAAAVVVTIALTCALGLVDVPRFLVCHFSGFGLFLQLSHSVWVRLRVGRSIDLKSTRLDALRHVLSFGWSWGMACRLRPIPTTDLGLNIRLGVCSTQQCFQQSSRC